MAKMLIEARASVSTGVEADGSFFCEFLYFGGSALSFAVTNASPAMCDVLKKNGGPTIDF